MISDTNFLAEQCAESNLAILRLKIHLLIGFAIFLERCSCDEKEEEKKSLPWFPLAESKDQEILNVYHVMM